MYQKYQTDAVVLASREQAEADKVYALYTQEFGLLRARASAVRSEGSKMRYALQNYALVSVSLVRGKRNWRIAGTRAIEHFAIQENLVAVQAFGRIADLATKLIAGEEKNDYIFETLVAARKALVSPSAGLEVAIPTIEILSVARILYALGYISAEALNTQVFTHVEFSETILREAEALRVKLLSSINNALSETQLIRR